MVKILSRDLSSSSWVLIQFRIASRLRFSTWDEYNKSSDSIFQILNLKEIYFKFVKVLGQNAIEISPIKIPKNFDWNADNFCK